MNSWFEKLCDKYLNYKSLHPLNKIRINIKDNVINGYVEYDKYETAYIEIKFDMFSNSEINKLNKILNDKLINTYKAINGVVPDDMYNCGIKILPDSFDDMEITSDYSVSNIDILSVLNVFKKRLDKNNFLIFKMRGFEFNKSIEYSVKTIDDIFTHNFKSTNDNTALTDLYDVNVCLLHNVKYPTISFDFIYTDIFKALNSQMNSQLKYSGRIKAEALNLNIDQYYNLEPSDKIKDCESLLFYLIDSNYLSEILELTQNLIKHNALMPELFTTGDFARIRWIPSLFDENVLNLCRKHLEFIPDDLIHFKNKKLTKENQLLVFISLIIEGLFNVLFENREFEAHERTVSNVNIQLITTGKIKLKKANNSIQNLSRIFSVYKLNELEFSYVMFLNHDLEVEIKIKDENGLRNLESDDEFKYLKFIYDLFSQFKIENTMYDKIKLTDEEFIIFSRKIIPILRFVNVELHKNFEIMESEVNLVMDYNLTPDKFNFKNLNKIEWIIELKDTNMSLDEFLRYDSDVIKTQNTYYIVEGVNFRRISSAGQFLLMIKDKNRLLKLALLNQYFDIKFTISDRLKKLINPSKIYDVPDALTGYLRAYQKIGYSWLIQNTKSGFGSILADDMGLGKTLQVLACLLYFKETRFIEDETSLIIVPPTLLSNWEHEIKKFTPDLTYYIYHGQKRKFPLEHYDIILTSYNIIRLDLELFLDKSWFICVLDEAQNIKNPKSQQTRAIKQINAFNKIAITGTPIENRLSDYWSIFDFTNKNYFPTLNDFKEEYIIPIEKLESEDALKNLKKVAKPFVLRRLKSDNDIKKQLPEKIVNDVYATLSKKQIKLYNAILDGIFEKIDAEKGIGRKGTILQTITALKQACNHPEQYLKNGDGKISDSGKMELLINILTNILDMNEKVIIFTQYVKMGEIIQNLVSKKLKEEVLFLHGSLGQKEKNSIINTFQKNDEFKILVATLKTGGVGLNLTAAQNVIHYDLWWNPAVENQATDRVHRIGQEKDVMVYRFITKGTLEEEIDRISKTKTDLAKKAISNDETFITELSTEELKEILSLRL